MLICARKRFVEVMDAVERGILRTGGKRDTKYAAVPRALLFYVHRTCAGTRIHWSANDGCECVRRRFVMYMDARDVAGGIACQIPGIRRLQGVDDDDRVHRRVGPDERQRDAPEV